MAILGAFQAEIQVDGKALPEFDDDDSQQRASRRFVSKLVEVPLGAEFSVRVCALGEKYMPSEDLAMRLRIDGQLEFGELWEREDQDHDINIHGLLNRSKEGITTLQPLQFSSINFVEAAQNVSSGSMSVEQWHDLGTMTVTIHKVTNISRVDYYPQMATADPITIENHKLKAHGITQSVTSVLPLPYDSMADLISVDSDMHDLTRSLMITIMTSLLGNTQLPLSNSNTVPKDRPGSASFNSTMDRIISQSTGLSDTYAEMAIGDEGSPKLVSAGSSTPTNLPEPIPKQPSTSNEPPEPISRQPSPSTDAPEPISENSNDSSSSSDDGATIKKATNQRTMGLWPRAHQRSDTPSGSVPKRKRDDDATTEESASEDNGESDEATEGKRPSRKIRRED
ncbi:MAG: hypothetical protein Q9172_006050 [Xanthocarpia lactea]